MKMKKIMIIAMAAADLLVSHAALVVDLSGDWNTSTSGNLNYTLPAVNTNTVDTKIYNDSFSTPILATGQAGVGGGYTGPTLYGAFRQYNAGGSANPSSLRAGSGDYVEAAAGASTVTSASGEFDFLYLVKKADFANGLDAVANVGFDSSSTFYISASVWSGVSKSLRAVVQNGSTWYISQDANTVGSSGGKTIVSNASSALWAVWDPATDISSGLLDFTTTVSGSTFTDIRAVGIYAAFQDGITNPNYRIGTLQVGAVEAGTSAANFLLTGSVTGGNGDVSPTSVSVSAGSSQNFVVTASNYYRIASLTTNGTPVDIALDNNSTSVNFLWSNVQADGALAVTFTNQVADSGTPYEWLVSYGLTNGGATFDQAAADDTDMDGLQAWQEYIAGTVPTDSASTLDVVENPRNVLNWSTVSGRVYEIHWSTNLLSGLRGLASNVVPPYTNEIPDAHANFYQIKVRMQ